MRKTLYTAVAAVAIAGFGFADSAHGQAGQQPAQQNNPQQVQPIEPIQQPAQQPARVQPGQANQQQQADRPVEGAAQRQRAERGPAAFLLVVPVPVNQGVTGVAAGAAVEQTGELAPDADDIRETLGEVSEAAIKGDFGDVVERLVDADRNRIGATKFDDAGAALQAVQAQINAAWEAKFGDEFDVEEDSLALASFQIVQGQVPENAEAMTATYRVFPGNEEEDYNLEPGREIAVVGVPRAMGLQGLVVPMIDEAYGWKIDVPNSITAPVLRDNLLDHLKVVAAQLPTATNELEAQRLITHHVLMALNGVEQGTGVGGGAANPVTPVAPVAPTVPAE